MIYLIVEVSSIITEEGPQPITWVAFKSAPRGMVQVMKSVEELTISEALTGNYNRAIQALTSNPLVPSGEMAKSLLDEMLAAHEKHLPQFANRIKDI